MACHRSAALAQTHHEALAFASHTVYLEDEFKRITIRFGEVPPSAQQDIADQETAALVSNVGTTGIVKTRFDRDALQVPEDAFVVDDPGDDLFIGKGYLYFHWNGWDFNFTEPQARVVEYLYKVYLRNKTTIVSKKDMLTEAGSVGDKFTRIFRLRDGTIHSALGTLIVDGPTRGTCRMQKPPPHPSKADRPSPSQDKPAKPAK